MVEGSAIKLGRPSLPDGLVVIVKHECETCKMIAPLLAEFEATTYTQDDPSFPAGVDSIHDAVREDLAPVLPARKSASRRRASAS